MRGPESNHGSDQIGDNESAESLLQFTYSYTVILFVLAGLALMMVFSHEFVIQMTPNEIVTPILRFVQALEAIIFLFASGVAVLRTYRSSLAAPTTVAVSILLALWVPFGTAAFVYWLGWVRKRERPQAGETGS